jgi:hypothetical protein
MGRRVSLEKWVIEQVGWLPGGGKCNPISWRRNGLEVSVPGFVKQNMTSWSALFAVSEQQRLHCNTADKTILSQLAPKISYMFFFICLFALWWK